MNALDVAIDRYGGQRFWDNLISIKLRVLEFDGILPRVKGIGKTFSVPKIGTVFPKQFRIECTDYPTSQKKGVFDCGRVGFFDDHQTQYSFDHENYRSRFSGMQKLKRWEPLDALYFFGYVLCTYLSIPFILKSLPHSTKPWKDGGHRIRAQFPLAIHTHNPDQEFFFDKSGLLLRHDYHAEILGPAYGAHLTSNYKTISGLPIATHRDVYARIGKITTPVRVLYGRLDPLEVTVAPRNENL